MARMLTVLRIPRGNTPYTQNQKEILRSNYIVRQFKKKHQDKHIKINSTSNDKTVARLNTEPNHHKNQIADTSFSSPHAKTLIEESLEAAILISTWLWQHKSTTVEVSTFHTNPSKQNILILITI